MDEASLLELISASAAHVAATAPPPKTAPPPAPPQRPAPRVLDAAGPSALPVESALWVEKHKPATVDQLIGNSKLVSDLRTWLKDWHRVHLSGDPPPKGKDAPKKAVLISGPPGIGKTSAATIICKQLGYEGPLPW